MLPSAFFFLHFLTDDRDDDMGQEEECIPVYGYSRKKRTEEVARCNQTKSLCITQIPTACQGTGTPPRWMWLLSAGKERQGNEVKRQWGEWGDEMGWHLRVRGWLSLKIAVCHFFGTLIPLLFISKCQETIFSFDLVWPTPSETLWVILSQSRKIMIHDELYQAILLK